MIITLVKADFSANNIGTLDSFAVLTNFGIGCSYNGPTSVSTGEALNATITIADGYVLTNAGVTMGGVALDVVTITDNVITISIDAVTGIIIITVLTETDTGESTTPSFGVGGTLVTSGNMAGAYLCENSSYVSTTYSDGITTSGTYFIYDLIPVEPSTTYRLAYGRAYFELDSTGAQIGRRGNLTSGATDFTFTTSSTAAYISVAFKYEEVATADVKLQTQSLVQTSEVLLSTLTSDYADGYGLNSAEYSDKEDANFYVYKNIPVTGGVTYAIPYARSTWFLDADKASLYRKNLTTEVTNWIHTVTSDVAYISASLKHAECDKDEAKLITYEFQWI